MIFLWDLKFMIIPDKFVLGGFLLTLVFYLGEFLMKGGDCNSFSLSGCNFLHNFLGAIFGGGFFGILFWFSGGKWIGGGDVKLGVWLGFLIGIKGIYPWLTISYVLGRLFLFFCSGKGRRK